MEPEKLLEALHTAEKLKDTTRHCYTSKGRHESVAEHSWRIALMAFWLRDEFPQADMDKVIRMCLIHDLGECFTGDIPAFDKTAAGMIQTNLRAKEVKESEADAEIARQKKMVDLAAQEAEVQQRKLDAEVRKQADAELYRRQKEAEAQKYEAERAAEAAKFAKQQEAEGIALVGKAEAEAIRQKGLAEAEAMKQKAEAYKQYNDAAVAEMMIKVLPEIARSVAQPLSSIDKVSIIGGDASGVSGVSGNVPVLMAQTMEAMKEATGIDMRDIVRANSIEAKTDRNITIKTEPEGEA